MNGISAVIIAKNDESMIKDCLDSISFCDEIIVIDGGSEDKTAEIARKMGAKVYRHMSNDFSDMRNFGLEKANNEWILYIDTDERLTKELYESINNKTLLNDKNISTYRLKRKNYYYGKHEWPHVDILERLFKKDKLKKWYGKLHESPLVNGQIGELDGFLLHYSHQDLTSMLKTTIEWSKIEAELRLENKHPRITWWRFPRVMTTAFIESFIKQKGYKAGTIGLIESIYQAFSMFITYARLWEMQQNNSEKKNI